MVEQKTTLQNGSHDRSSRQARQIMVTELWGHQGSKNNIPIFSREEKNHSQRMRTKQKQKKNVECRIWTYAAETIWYLSTHKGEFESYPFYFQR